MDNLMAKIKKHEILYLTILAGLIGFIVYICIYGITSINVTKDAWLYSNGDLKQHYFGWIFYRNCEWSFPIGNFNGLSYPNDASVVFTDSIPLFAIIFKAISGILPETFQYMGLFGVLCYILQGVFAFTLLRKFINNKFYAIIGTVFFVISPYLLQRMFAHTALSANFLILAGICIFTYREWYVINSKKKLAIWTSLLALCVTIHLYYVPMIVIIMLSTFVVEFIENKKTWKSSGVTFFVSCLVAIIIIYILGGLVSSNFSFDQGADEYNTNLNTFIEPQGYSSILSGLDINEEGNFESFGYLGVGIILLGLISIILIVKNYKKVIEMIKSSNTIFVLLCLVFGMLLSIGTSVKISGNVLFYIPYPGIIRKVITTFRATGRFIWLVDYLIFFVSMYIVSKYSTKKIANIVIVVCLAIQIFDLYPSMQEKFEYTNEVVSEYDEKLWDLVLKDIEHIKILKMKNYEMYDLIKIANIAFHHDCTVSRFYFAREIKNVNETEEKYIQDLANNIIEENAIYLIKKENIDMLQNTNLNCYEIEDYIVITSNEIIGLERI